jgi:hypothetical protein
MKCPELPRGGGGPTRRQKTVLEFKTKTSDQANKEKRLLPSEGRQGRERKASCWTSSFLSSSGLSHVEHRQPQLQKRVGELNVLKKNMPKFKLVSEEKKRKGYPNLRLDSKAGSPGFWGEKEHYFSKEIIIPRIPECFLKGLARRLTSPTR